jgi:glucose dehydrogenase
MRRSRLIIAIVLFLAGLVWLGQGSGLIKGSAMSGSSFWSVVGVVLVVVAIVVLVNERRRPATGA